jgi:hypothetical protein
MGSVKSGVLSADEIQHTVLIEALGGEDLLSLMIGAHDFEPYYSRNCIGLQFIFGEPERWALLVPLSVNSFYEAETCYQIGVTVSIEEKTLSDKFKPSFSQYVIDDLRELIPAFEKMAKVALTFN